MSIALDPTVLAKLGNRPSQANRQQQQLTDAYALADAYAQAAGRALANDRAGAELWLSIARAIARLGQ